MLTRCYNSRCAAFQHYGGRGISVCNEWRHDFWRFVADMGPRPPRYTLERIDNNVGYSKSNCRWATRAEQTRNKRCNIWLTRDGKTQILTDWAAELGVLQSTLYRRVVYSKQSL